MPRTILAVSTALLSAVLVFAVAPDNYYHPENPWIDWTGGPDAYGYTAIDSDQPGGPTYMWKDITAIGTQVQGLADDNYVGPFNIGFNFNYYWYTRNQVYIGSNGYLKFPPAVNIASPFPASIPLSASPNDYLAAYLADLDFTAGGTCYYWSNNVDSFVVSFINVPAWQATGSSGSHTFQIILSGNNNKIRYQYGAQQGTFYNNDDIIGIENSTGQIGVERLHDAYIPHADYAILFNRPDSTTYAVHDLGISGVMNAASQAIFILNNTAYNPVVYVKNYGNQPEASLSVSCQIRNSAGAAVYNQTATVPATTAGQEVQITYPTAWTPTAVGYYTISSTVSLTGDMNPANNTKAGEIEVVVLPGELKYDDNVANYSTAWQGPTGGYGMKFTPPSYPVTLTQVKIYIGTITTAPQNFTAQILDDNGTGGAPGSVLFTQVVSAATQNSWYTVNCNVTISSGSFYAAWLQSNQNTTNVGIDSTGPISRQTWEFTTAWAPYRNLELEEAMIRVVTGAALNVNITTSPVSPPIQIPAGGGSFNYNVTIQNLAASPASFQVWNMVTLPNGSNYGPALGPLTLNMNPSQTINRTRSQSVPASAPAGTYSYRTYAGSYPGGAIDSSSFTFTKLGMDLSGKNTGWFSSGEAFPGEMLESSMSVPSEFALTSIYPNPFNPFTNIRFALSDNAQVKLTVYDISGQEVAVLLDSWMSAGEYETEFDGSNLASGVYFCKLSANGIESVKKMMLLK